MDRFFNNSNGKSSEAAYHGKYGKLYRCYIEPRKQELIGTQDTAIFKNFDSKRNKLQYEFRMVAMEHIAGKPNSPCRDMTQTQFSADISRILNSEINLDLQDLNLKPQGEKEQETSEWLLGSHQNAISACEKIPNVDLAQATSSYFQVKSEIIKNTVKTRCKHNIGVQIECPEGIYEFKRALGSIESHSAERFSGKEIPLFAPEEDGTQADSPGQRE